MSGAREFNFDGLVGPTHNYAGLSYGNVASMSHRAASSNPRQAALQGLAKMKFLHDLGIGQAVLPPHERPHLPTLRKLGYSGPDADILAKVNKDDPALLAAVSSSSSMWAANAATVSPSADTVDGRVHFTPANLMSNRHRAIEAPTTARILRRIFADEAHFAHHEPLPSEQQLSDEGAANHMRLCSGRIDEPGFEIFVYGRSAGTQRTQKPTKFPARQTLNASETIATSHGLQRVNFAPQCPQAIDAGAFHNDVVAVANENVLLYHQLAWENAPRAVESWRRVIPNLVALEAADADVPLADAVSSYLFNSQLVTLSEGTMALIAPLESKENPRTKAFIDQLLAMRTPIRSVHYVDLRQSMQNGGGPACLRLRVVLTEPERAATHQGAIFNGALHVKLKAWIERHYRDTLHAQDLADPKLLRESLDALDELTGILALGAIYEFQGARE